MKYLKILFALAMLIMPAVVLAQVDSSVVDSAGVLSSFAFDKYLTFDSLARYFGANPFLFAVLVGMIFVLTEFAKRKVKKNGELFFVDNRSIALPFVIGIFLAFISPTGFGFWYSIRFGLQGAVVAIIIYMSGNFIWGGSPRRGA